MVIKYGKMFDLTLVAATIKSIIIWDVTQWRLLLACCSALKMEAVCSSETSVNFYRTAQRHIPGDSTLHSNVQLASVIFASDLIVWLC
jgi:hypothetical protein